MDRESNLYRILHSPLVTAKTQAILEERWASGSQPPSHFSPETFAHLETLARIFLPRIENIEVNWAASQLDQELASGNSDGWRYAVLPQQPEALLKDLAEGFVRNGTAFLGRLSPIQDLFLKDLTAALAKILYSHPIAQESIGYTGFADGLGWSRIGVGESEVWEKSRDSVIPDSEPARPPSTHPVPGRKYSTTEVVDVVIVGSGPGGAPLAARLCAAGLKVVMIEAGKYWDPAADFATDEREQQKLYWKDERLSAGADPIPFGGNNSGIGVGGSTVHYTAFVPRPTAKDFQLFSATGVGQDWPFGLQELGPYLAEVEAFIGVSGPSPYPWDKERSYPLDPLPLNASAQLMEQGCQELGITTAPGPNAALSRPYYVEGVGWRGPCVNRGFCQAGCNRGAKGSMDVTYIPFALAHGLDLRPDSFAIQVETQGDTVKAVVYEACGKLVKQPCKALFLCAGAIETPRLLLLNGIGNQSGQVGKNFMAHGSSQVWGFFEQETRPWKGIPGGLISEDFRNPQDPGGFILQSIGVMPLNYVEMAVRYGGFSGPKLGDHMAQFNRLAGINIHGECLPHPDNRLELSNEKDVRGLPKPLLHFTMHENEHLIAKRGRDLMTEIWQAAGAEETWSYPRSAHTLGTCRMGIDPSSSVVDPTCRVHELKNLYICDTSIYPSSLTANPALTMMSISLRTADLFLSG